ncbi:hypothetical protein KC19_VG155500 [Ceratodon purpureus]|uniref:Uncharacterized protein n=1 Tax=Ceratodon purpureus TaxID=3225 RepID=A0A8T0HQG8_CERPU|nr:hypothetical protein KC19_VG155500 [Ceratodon purpureus]
MSYLPKSCRLHPHQHSKECTLPAPIGTNHCQLLTPLHKQRSIFEKNLQNTMETQFLNSTTVLPLRSSSGKRNFRGLRSNGFSTICPSSCIFSNCCNSTVHIHIRSTSFSTINYLYVSL